MRRTELLIAAVAAGGLVFAIMAEAAQQRLLGQAPQHATGTFASIGARDAEREWQTTDLTSDEYLALTFGSRGGLSEEALARITAIEPAAGGEATGPQGAELIVRNLGGEVLALMADGTLSEQERVGRFRQILLRDFDLPLIAKFALGRHWRQASDEQRRAYVDAFAGNILRSYAGRILSADISSIEVDGTQAAGKEDVMVLTRVVRRNGDPIELSWRLRQREAQYRIIDVVVEGVSLALTKRQEFASIIQSGGTDIDGLIRKLAGKAA